MTKQIKNIRFLPKGEAFFKDGVAIQADWTGDWNQRVYIAKPYGQKEVVEALRLLADVIESDDWFERKEKK